MTAFRVISVFAIFFAYALANGAMVDSWVVSSKVTESTAKKSDGSIIRLDPKQELSVTLDLATEESYGYRDSRDFKVQVVDNVVKIDLQTYADFVCHPRYRSNFPSVAPHVAHLDLILKPGVYHVVVNGNLAGTLDATLPNGQFKVNPLYKNVIVLKNDLAFAEAFGNLSELKISNGCTVEFVDDPKGITATYSFPESRETLPNGDIVIHKAEQGSVLMTSMYTRPEDCQNPKGAGWVATVTSEKRDAQWLLTSRAGQGVSESFSVNGKSCSK